MREVARYILKINAGAYSFEHANVRHEHEYVIWDDLKLPDGKKIIPGMLLHASNVVEHPLLIAEWLERFAKRVGARERDRRHRLRVFVTGQLQNGSASNCGLGEVSSLARRGAHSEPPASLRLHARS